MYKQFVDKSESVIPTCVVCFKECQSQDTVKLPKCKHIVHFRCFLVTSLRKTTACPKCCLIYDEVMLSGTNPLVKTRVMVHNYPGRYCIGLSHYINYERKGYVFIVGIFKYILRENGIEVDIAIKGYKNVFSIECYKMETTLRKYESTTCNTKKSNDGWRSYYLKPQVAEEEIENVQVDIDCTEFCLIIETKIVLTGGLQLSEFPNTNDIIKLLKISPMIGSSTKPSSSHPALLN